MRVSGLFVLFALLPPLPVLGDIEGCGKDIECKGDRICVKRECVAPAEQVSSSIMKQVAAESFCTRDNDCKGDRICIRGECVASPQLVPAVMVRKPPDVPTSTADPRIEDPFGADGQVVPMGSISVSYISASISTATASVTTISIAPKVFFFLTKNFAFGLSGNLSCQSFTQGNTSGFVTGLGIAPIVAYNLWLSESVSLVPGVAVALDSRELPPPTPGGLIPRLTTVSLQFIAPLLVHPARHFFIGIGPVFDYDVSASFSNTGAEAPKTTAVGAESYIGGYF